MFAQRNNRSHSRNRRAKLARPVRRQRKREYAKARRSLKRNRDNFFDAPEVWHEPTGRQDFQICSLPPGKSYRHVVSADQVKTRLSKLPERFLKGLEVVQLSTMTHKKRCLPCYGLQWGCAIYLYPFHDTLEEHYHSPPPQALVLETKMYGAKWDHPQTGLWRLRWTEKTARDYLLNNILVHELGHLVDTWNTNTTDQERYAEWFAIEYGYRWTGGNRRPHRRRKVRRRHH